MRGYCAASSRAPTRLAAADMKLMEKLTIKVLERLIYEGLLVHNQLKGRRWRIQLEDMLFAGKEEPRILELLPAIVLYRPTMIWRLKKDLKNQVPALFADDAPKEWMGIPIETLRKQAQLVQKIMIHRQSKQRSIFASRNPIWSDSPPLRNKRG